MAAVLVLGGYGLIGSAIVERLRAEGVEVVVNAAGVLQQDLADDPVAVQEQALLALIDAGRPPASGGLFRSRP